jgi:hypothetical protein
VLFPGHQSDGRRGAVRARGSGTDTENSLEA